MRHKNVKFWERFLISDEKFGQLMDISIRKTIEFVRNARRMWIQLSKTSSLENAWFAWE